MYHSYYEDLPQATVAGLIAALIKLGACSTTTMIGKREDIINDMVNNFTGSFYPILKKYPTHIFIDEQLRPISNGGRGYVYLVLIPGDTQYKVQEVEYLHNIIRMLERMY